MQFQQIIGQEAVKARLLQSAQQNRVPHAQLFTGKIGVGKLPLAIAYAQYLCCENPSVEDSCGVCPSCKKFAILAHPDLHFVFPFEKNKDKKREFCEDIINDFRQALVENPYLTIDEWTQKIAEGKSLLIYTSEGDKIIQTLNLKNFEAKYKIMIIWLPEKMNDECSNKLLKILEEPFENTVFLLVSDTPEMLLSTIISRVQQINLPPIEENALAEKLQNEFSLSKEQSTIVARNAMGSFSQAREIIEQSESSKWNFKFFVELMRAAYQSNFLELRQWAEMERVIIIENPDDPKNPKIIKEKLNREEIKSLLKYCQRMIRESFIFNLHQPKLNYMNAEEQAFVAKFAPFINHKNVEEIVEELQKLAVEIEVNVLHKISFFDFAVKLTTLLKK